MVLSFIDVPLILMIYALWQSLLKRAPLKHDIYSEVQCKFLLLMIAQIIKIPHNMYCLTFGTLILPLQSNKFVEHLAA